MDYHNYVSKMKSIYNNILSFIEDTEEEVNCYMDLEKSFAIIKSESKKEDILMILQIINSISENHHRSSNFFQKIELILSNIQDVIKKTISNFELFEIFEYNKRILLLLLKKMILIFDNQILEYLHDNSSEYEWMNYLQYFAPELNNDQNENIDEKFEEKRLLGENDSYICELIRQDLIDEFIVYVNQTNLPLELQINDSIFETNIFLLECDSTLIEYAAFFGSIQIFNYLRINGVELTPSLWMYAIHGKNEEIIQIIEENNIVPRDSTFEKCLKESIKCHHNEIAHYIHDNLLSQNIEEVNSSYVKYQSLVNHKLKEIDPSVNRRWLVHQTRSFRKIDFKYNHKRNRIAYSFHYYNYEFIPDDFSEQFILYYLVKYNYHNLINILWQAKQIDIDSQLSIIEFNCSTTFYGECTLKKQNQVDQFHFLQVFENYFTIYDYDLRQTLIKFVYQRGGDASFIRGRRGVSLENEINKYFRSEKGNSLI